MGAALDEELAHPGGLCCPHGSAQLYSLGKKSHKPETCDAMRGRKVAARSRRRPSCLWACPSNQVGNIRVSPAATAEGHPKDPVEPSYLQTSQLHMLFSSITDIR